MAPAPISGNLRFLTFPDRKNGPDIGAGAFFCLGKKRFSRLGYDLNKHSVWHVELKMTEKW